MNSFGLGLVLNFTDNASAGMSRVSQTFNQMNGFASQMVDSSDSALFAVQSLAAAGMSLSTVGEQVSSFGQSILGFFAGTSQAVIDTGMEMQGYRMQLRALYGEDAFEQKMASIQEYAKNSVFEVQGLTQAVVTMKAVGIEAMDSVTTSSGNTTQTLLDYASDIAAMFPNMRNAYGTGVNAAMGALKEYIAEGNALSLKRGAGLDITGILGEDKGATIEERTRQVADLVEQLGIATYTTKLLGTPTQQLSKMQDILFNTMSKIADGGVFQAYTTLLTTLADWMDNLYEDTERYEGIVSLLTGTLTAVLTPLQSLLEYALEIADAIIDWALEHEKLAQGILIAVAAIGALLVVGGTILKLSGSFMMVMSSMMQMSYLASQGISIFNVFGRSIGILATKILPLVGIAALVYTAWKNNFGGIRDIVTKAFKDIVATVKLVFDAFTDNTLSFENFEKAKQLGILPLIETILDLKYRFEFFKDGFVKGWATISEKVTGIVKSVAETLGSIFGPVFDKIGQSFNKLGNTETKSWFNSGEVIGELAGIATAIIPIIAVGGKLIKGISQFAPLIKGIFSLVSANPVMAIIIAVAGALIALYTTSEDFRNSIDEMFSTLGSILKDTFGQVMGALTQAFESLKPTLGTVKDAFLSFLPQVGEFVVQIVVLVADLVTSLLPVVIQVIGVIMNLVLQLMPVVMQIITVVMDVVKTLLPVIVQIIQMLVPFIVEIVGLVLQLVPIITQIINLVLDVVMGVLPAVMSILQLVMDLISAILPIVVELINKLMPFITQLIGVLVQIVDTVLVCVVDLLNTLIPIITELIALIVPMLMQIIDALIPIITCVLNLVSMLLSKLMPVIRNLMVIVSAVLEMVMNVLTPVIKVITQIVEAILVILIPIIEVLITAIGFIIDVVMGIVQVIVSIITYIVVIITGIVNVVAGIIDAIVQFVMAGVAIVVGVVRTIIDTVVAIISGIILAVQTVWDGIVAVFTGVIDFFAGIFQAVFDVISGVFQSIADFFTEVWNGIVSAFDALGDTISGAIRGAINGVLSGAVGIINGFIGAINACIGLINKIPNVSIKKLTLLEVPQLAQGGVIDKPTIAQVGEAGPEAVVPLKNNTKGLDLIAEKVAPRLPAPQANGGNSGVSRQEVNNDYSVTFSAGSVVIQLSNASDAELEKAAEKLMKIIERKQQLKAMARA